MNDDYTRHIDNKPMITGKNMFLFRPCHHYIAYTMRMGSDFAKFKLQQKK